MLARPSVLLFNARATIATYSGKGGSSGNPGRQLQKAREYLAVAYTHCSFVGVLLAVCDISSGLLPPLVSSVMISAKPRLLWISLPSHWGRIYFRVEGYNKVGLALPRCYIMMFSWYFFTLNLTRHVVSPVKSECRWAEIFLFLGVWARPAPQSPPLPTLPPHPQALP